MTMVPARVLLVEDERIVAFNLTRQLTKLGYVVVASAVTGEEALQQIEAARPDIILMDIRIAGPIDGIETTSRIAPDLRIPVIYLTAYAEDSMLERARATKPYGYLLKPFFEAELHATIQMALARSLADASLRDSEKRLDRLLTARSLELEQQISERLKVEEALIQARKLEAIGQLTSGIAHDFNNLLTVIVGGLTLLERRLVDSANTDLVTAALDAALRGAGLVRQLLSFGRRQMVQPEHIDINMTLRGNIDIVDKAVGPLIHVEYRLDAAPAICCVDRQEFDRAVLNLAVNSRQAMPDGGTVLITTDTVSLPATEDGMFAGGDYVRLEIRDTGHGMSPEVLARAFDPFFTTKNPGEGSGLGLSQAYGFARQSGGYVTIESAVGCGTAAILFLPVAGTSDQPLAAIGTAGASYPG